MASGSFNVTTSNQYISGKVEWSSVADNVNNKSTVTATLRLSRTNTGYTTDSSGSFTINIGGSPKSNSGSFTFTYNSNTLCVTHSAVIDHSSDGSKSITITVSCDMTRFTMAVQSGTAVLDNIPRESSISSFPNFTIGNSVAISISRATTSFTHTVSMWVGSTWIAEWTGIGASATLTFDSAALGRLYGAIGTSATVTLRCYTFNGSTQIGTSYTTKTATGSRANGSTITTFNNFTIGDNIPVVISEPLSAFSHTIMLYVGSTKVCERTSIDTSTTLVLSATEQDILYNAFKAASSGYVTLRCYTYHVGVQVRDYTSKSATASVSSSIVPTFSSITAEETISGVSALGVYLQQQSRIKFTINGAAGAKFSTISSYKIVFNGVTYNNQTATTGAINTSGTLTATATITDSRGRTATKTISVTLVAYDNPKITSLSVVRCNSDGTLNPLGTYTKVSIRGSVSSISSKNTMRYLIKTTSRGGTTWVTKKDASPAIPTLTADDVVGTYEIISSFDVRVELIDNFNTSVSTTVLGTGEVTMSWSKKGIGVGKIWEEGALDIEGYARIHQNGAILKLIGDDQLYLEFYPAGVTAGRKAWLGYGGPSSIHFEIKNDYPNGDVRVRPGSGGSTLIEGRARMWGGATIYGAAADTPLISRGIEGSDGAGNLGKLHLNYIGKDDVFSYGDFYIEKADPVLTIRNNRNNDVSLIFDRNLNANWRVLSTVGTLAFQCDWLSSGKTAYYNAFVLNFGTGGATFKDKVIATEFHASDNVRVGSNGQLLMGKGPSDAYLSNTKSNKFLQLRDDGILQYDGNNVWHDGNFPNFRNLGGAGGTNLNDCKVSGTYIQYTSNNASLALNYPQAIAGILTVTGTAASNIIVQTYHAYNNSSFWVRSYYNGTWYAWRTL